MDTFKGKDAYDKAWDFLKKQVGGNAAPNGCDRKLYMYVEYMHYTIHLSTYLMLIYFTQVHAT